MMQTLGMTLLDDDGSPIRQPIGGGRLRDIRRIIWNNPPENMENVSLTIACDVLNPACGPNGAALVFGPQKGANAASARLLDAGLAHWATLLEEAGGRRIRDEPGSGAAGGVAMALVA